MCPNGLVSAVLAAMIASQLPGEGAVIQDVIYAVIFFSVILSNLMSFRIEKGGLKWVGKAMFYRHVAEGPTADVKPSGAADGLNALPEGASAPDNAPAPAEHPAASGENAPAPADENHPS